ncbi:hypothetical protein G4Y79_02895 [Phototrophicus methaneseepsis]|uniref:Uncharacterized protein n=1 Tax=Phototrophicus methaneseepsis TaxID=2710758 RepID=A0A7S8EAE1_9CHLR|nr:hypothetical protein [Phototrophicus methaneseepsis]QPC83343.1 hypothetical protein G4Y79_02895 [Phototrophicus methaneseepsis]
MKNILSKLDRIAESWINGMDSQLQEPVVRCMTGDVFTDGTTAHKPSAVQTHADQAAQDATKQVTMNQDVVEQPAATAQSAHPMHAMHHAFE